MQAFNCHPDQEVADQRQAVIERQRGKGGGGHYGRLMGTGAYKATANAKTC
jgi:hypothetical protein